MVLSAVVVSALVVVVAAVVLLRGGIEDEAIDRCKSAVADSLKSPSSAKFGDVSAFETSDMATYHENYAEFEKYRGYSGLTRWVVTGDVDASNSYGAMVRNHFNCSAIASDGEIVGVELSYIE